jgi:hypothetical protein
MKGLVPGVGATIRLAAAVLYGYFATGMAPVATTASSIPFEGRLAHMALHARIAKEMPAPAPVAADEANLLAGAHIYKD